MSFECDYIFDCIRVGVYTRARLVTIATDITTSAIVTTVALASPKYIVKYQTLTTPVHVEFNICIQELRVCFWSTTGVTTTGGTTTGGTTTGGTTTGGTTTGGTTTGVREIRIHCM